MYAFKENIYFNLPVFNFPFEHVLLMAVVAVPSDGQQGEHTPCEYRKHLQVAELRSFKGLFILNKRQLQRAIYVIFTGHILRWRKVKIK